MALSREDAAWLISLMPWGMSFVRRLRVDRAEHEDVLQEAFACAVAQWAAFVAPAELPAAVARRRWLADWLVRVAGRFRYNAARNQAHLSHELDWAVRVVGLPSHEGPVAAREQLRGLEAITTAERWRVWLAYEVDELPVTEIARQEGRPQGTIYDRLRRARKDLAAALGRERAAGARPVVRRPRALGKKGRA